MLEAADVAKLPDPRIHRLPDGARPSDWWRAFFVTAWVTGARVEAMLRLRWEDVDHASGRVLSRAADLKQRKDSRPEISAALPFLLKVRGIDPRLLPWNHDRRTLYAEFYRIQEAAGIELACRSAGQPGHVCGQTCHLYGFHAFRYAHARFNYANPELQNQMGHASPVTTDHYRKWGERQVAEYGAYVPEALSGGKDRPYPPDQRRENGGKAGGKGPFRVVRA
jgi:integrase